MSQDRLTETQNHQEMVLAPLLKKAGSVIESQIRGQSMGMTLPQGTTIRIRCSAETDFPVGTVIAFLGGRGLVGHRVVGRGAGQHGIPVLLTRGDGMLLCDPPVSPDRVLGEVREWLDGETWRPLPGPPPVSPLRRVGMSVSLALLRVLLWVSPTLASFAAEKLLVLAGLLRPRQPVPPAA